MWFLVVRRGNLVELQFIPDKVAGRWSEVRGGRFSEVRGGRFSEVRSVLVLGSIEKSIESNSFGRSREVGRFSEWSLIEVLLYTCSK